MGVRAQGVAREKSEKQPQENGGTLPSPQCRCRRPQPAARKTFGPEHNDALAVARAAARAKSEKQPHEKGGASAIVLFLVLPPPSPRWAKTADAEHNDALALARADPDCGGCAARKIRGTTPSKEQGPCIWSRPSGGSGKFRGLTPCKGAALARRVETIRRGQGFED
jgi:hypothetical protein